MTGNRASTQAEGSLRQRLFAAKLRALVRDNWGDPGADAAPGTFPGGATLRQGRQGWVLAQDRPWRALGGALAWGRQAGVDQLHVLGEEATGLLARRAAAFARPAQVWRVEGRSVTAAQADPVPVEPGLPPEVEELIPVLAGAGAEPVVEHGVLTGEVLGLEVARVVGSGAGRSLQVGVGKFDREAQLLIHGDRPPVEALAAAVAAVREVRRPDAPAHQVNQLARERWLRSVVVANPAMVGASSLVPAPSPVLRTDLRQPAPAPAAGVDAAGRPLLVVCSTGIDVDLVPAAADARLADGRGPRLVLVVPETDDHPLTRALAAALAEPAEVVPVAGDWRRL